MRLKIGSVNMGIKRKIGRKIANLYGLYKNKQEYRKGAISRFKYELTKEYFTKDTNYGWIWFYQSYPPLNILGTRETICRFKVYGLENIIDKDKTILDIGGNVGFFSAYISQYVKFIDIVEYNKASTEICKKLLKYENIKNVNVYCDDFKKFEIGKKYDIIFSFAVHGSVGTDFKSYLEKIHSLLKKDGILLIESHRINPEKNIGDYLEPRIKDISFFEIKEKGKIDDAMGQQREFFYLEPI